MTSTNLSQKQLNFARVSIVCIDINKLPLKDILTIFIPPLDLKKEIKKRQHLLTGEYKLNPDQRKTCCYNSHNSPDYSNFDITLLYKLIRNLCPSLEPTKKWGNKPASNDLDVGDDIERIRYLRNSIVAHSASAELPNDVFTDLWSDVKCIIQRCQQYTTSNGCTTDYNKMLIDLERKTFTFDEYTIRKARSGAICVFGEPDVFCGRTACFEADISLEQDVYLPVSWEKLDGKVKKQLDVEDEKYRGSDNRQLLIHNVDKDDEAGYQAVLARNCDVNILSNKVYLRPKGDIPFLKALNATLENEEIHIHYMFKVSKDVPIKDIKWTKNNSELQVPSYKYRGGGEADNCLTILKAVDDDKGLYTCTVWNAVGHVSKSIELGQPNAEILSTTNLKVICGSDTKFDCNVSGHPRPDQVVWQNSHNGIDFFRIDADPVNFILSPQSLILRNATMSHQQYYQAVASNNIGMCTSNTLFLQVTGNLPNMSEVTCFLHGNSVKLKCDVFLYDESPALDNVYWTKGGKHIVIATDNGKYAGADKNDPSLTINSVNNNDAGDYQLIAVNAVGENKSNVLVLGGKQLREKIVVAAIDFGSTYSGYAFSFSDDFKTNPLRIHTNLWSSVQFGGLSYKAPTTVLLKPNKMFHSFGYDAEEKYAELSEAEEHKEWYYFSHFKMKLMNALDIPKDDTGSGHLFTKLDRNMEIEDIDGKNMPLMTIIAHVIRYLKEHLLRQLNDKNILEAVTADCIFWVLTVPTIWTESAKQFTREAAREAGIYDDHLMLAYEPEAAALYCRLLPIDRFESGGEHQELVLKTFERGKKFMVIDLGGGTVDFSIQETTDTGKMKSIHGVCGGPWGGTIVDQQFIQFLIKLVGADVFTEFKDESRSEYLELMRILEIKKKQVDYNTQTMIPIGVPIALFEILEEHTGCNISEIISKSSYSKSVTYLRDKLIFNASLLRTFFRSSLDNIISHLRDILEDPACQDLLGIVVVGGYADSHLVTESLKDAFPGRRIIVPMEAGLAVAKGAVLFGHDPDVIYSRVCRYTYGDDICLPFDENKHPYSNLTHINKNLYCNNIFRKFFEKGEIVFLGEKRSFTTDFDFRNKCRVYKREQPLAIKVYVSNQANPVFVYDVGCRVLGEIVVFCENEKWPETFTCTVEMEIAGTEIQVTASISTGEKAKASLTVL